MTCAACGKENREGRKFCAKCGAPLSLQCPACGAANEPDENFCGECGASLQGSGYGVQGSGPRIPKPRTPQPESRETRKVISIVFADLMGSTALQERLDPESVNRVMDAYYQAVRGPVEAAGGTVVQLLGDGVFCAFGIPRIAEDDALRAVRAAVGIQQAFREFLQAQQWLKVPIGLRVAVNTGEVVVSDEHPAGIGDPLNVAARLQQEARDGEVLIGQATRRLVAEAVTLERAGVFALKGRAGTVTAYRVVSLERPKGATTAFVGRDEELARLTAVYEAAVAKPAGHLAVLLGSPGLGKSRLIAELDQRLGGRANVIAAQCDAAGGATFAPIAEALREYLGGDGTHGSHETHASDEPLEAALPTDTPDRARIAAGISALLAGSPALPEETFFVIRRFLAALAKQKPVVLVIDDLQWAEPLLLDLVEHLIQWGSGVAMLVLVGARPELRDRRSSLATVGGVVSDVVTLSGLDAGAAMRLAANVIGAADLPAAVAAKVLATSEGNPLFVGELVRMLVDEGAIERQGDRWIVGANLAALEMPPTIHALLAARIERLQPEERTILEHASVVGRHFSRSAVAALLGSNGSQLDARLEALRRTELIEPDSGWFLGEPVLRFHHVLIRDAAYRRLLKGTRAELHERLANWIEGQATDAPEHDETIGWHLEQAHRLLCELGPIDTDGKALGERAAQRLSTAGRRALARDDVPVAADLLGRAIERLDAGDSARADLALDWCEALLSAGDVGAAARAIDELRRFAAAKGLGATEKHPSLGPQSSVLSPHEVGRLRAWHTCFTGQLTVMTAPQELQATADAVAGAAEEFAKLGDMAGEAKAHSVHAQALARLGRVGACEAALDKALAAARKAGDRRRANAVLAGAPLAALWGPSPVTRASGRCLDVVRVLRITQGAPAVEAVALSCQGVLEALRGRTDAARRMVASSRKMVEELGIAHRLFEADVFAARIDLLEGDAIAAECNLRSAYEGLRNLGLGIDAARAGALLGRALLAQDRSEEAESVSGESKMLAGDDLQASIAWRGVRAEALARRGEHAEAIDLAKAGVEIAAATDALLDHADARLALAAALRAAGRSRDAEAEERRAIDLWEAKGATLLADRARRDGAGVGRATNASKHERDRPPVSKGVEPSPDVLLDKEGGPRRRVRENTVTADIARFDEAVAARDADALAALLSDRFELVHHSTGLTYGQRGMLTTWRSLFDAQRMTFCYEVLATLGDSLALHRHLVSAEGFAEEHLRSASPAELEEICLTEIGEDARVLRFELFAPDHLGDAIVCLYQRYARRLAEGPVRECAASTARSVATVVGPFDLDRYATAFAPGIEAVDHRMLGTWSAHGRDALLEHFRSFLRLVEGAIMRADDVLALCPDGLLVRWTNLGTDRMGGGTYERPFLMLAIYGADGLIIRNEWFDVGREAEALARFEDLIGPREGTGHFANATTRLNEQFVRAWVARDWEAVTALHSPACDFDDRRSLMHMQVTLSDAHRMFFEVPNGRWCITPIATRGERLALSRVVFEGDVADGGGALAIDYLNIDELDDDGRFGTVLMFDPGDLDAAYDELDRRYWAGEGAAHPGHCSFMRAFGAAIASRDWTPVIARCVPNFIQEDHRRFAVLGTTVGAEAWARNFRTLTELAPDAIYRIDHIRFVARGACVFGTWRGTHDGARFENPVLAMVELDDRDFCVRTDIYEPEQIEQAFVRLAELAASNAEGQPDSLAPSLPTSGRDRGRGLAAPFLNAAWLAAARVTAQWHAREWHRLEQMLGARFRYLDRRRAALLDLDRAQYVAYIRSLGEMSSTRIDAELLATRGERLALGRMLIEVAGGDVGPSELENLSLFEIDEQGDPIALVRFDADDLDAAYAELDGRWEAGEGAEHGATLALARALGRAGAARDWDAQLALCAPDFVFCDHRLLGWGQTMQDAAAWIRVRQALVELAPDVQIRADHHRFSAHGWLQQVTQVGTREGGIFEMQWTTVIELDDHGRMSRLDAYDLEQLDEARARFDELRSPTPSEDQPPAEPADPFAAIAERNDAWAPFQVSPSLPVSGRDRGKGFSGAAENSCHDPLRIPPNAASAALEHLTSCADAGNWDAVRALCEKMVFEDRRRLFLTSGDGEQFVTNSRFVYEGGMRPSYTLLATRGDRLSLHRNLWRSINEGEAAEVETLEVFEVDEDGRIVAVIIFEPDDRFAASTELFERYAAKPADGASAELFDIVRAWNDHDLRRLRGLLPDDFYLEDRRRTGVGPVEGADAYVDSIAALYELSRDVRSEVLYTVSIAEHGHVSVSRWSGTNEEGGEFDAVYVLVGVLRDGRLAGMEIFELDDLDVALARFEELRPVRESGS